MTPDFGPEHNVTFMLGRIDGKIDALSNGQADMSKRLDGLDTRIQVLEGESVGRNADAKANRRVLAYITAGASALVSAAVAIATAYIGKL